MAQSSLQISHFLMTSLLLIYLVLICLLHLTELEWSGFCLPCHFISSGAQPRPGTKWVLIEYIQGHLQSFQSASGWGDSQGTHCTHCCSWNCLLQTPIPVTQGEQASEEGAGLGTSQRLFTIPSRKGYNLGDVMCMNVLHTFSLLALSYFF